MATDNIRPGGAKRILIMGIGNMEHLLGRFVWVESPRFNKMGTLLGGHIDEICNDWIGVWVVNMHRQGKMCLDAALIAFMVYTYHLL